MAALRELIIKISANSQSFQSEIQRASRMGTNYYKTMQQGGRQAATASRETQKALAGVTAQLNSTKSAALSLAGGMAGMFATSQLIQYADTWNMMSGRLKLASTSAYDFTNAQNELYDISQRTGTSLEDNAQLYSRIAQAMGSAGYASEDIAKVTETVATSLKLSGASAQETAAIVTQLSQALSSGVLSGDEFKSVMENGGRLARLMADGLGVNIGQLRDMAKAQQLTTDKIIPLLTNVDQLRKEFEQLAPTVSGSTQKVENAFMAWIGGADKASGASAALAGGLDSLANNIDEVATAAGVLVAVGVSRYFGNMAASAASATGALIQATKSEISLTAAKIEGAKSSLTLIAAEKSLLISGQKSLVEQLKLVETEKQRASIRSLLAKNSAEMVKINKAEIATTNELAAANKRLNSLTSVSHNAWSGVKSLFGGIPGMLMFGAAAWYSVYENTQLAHKEAQDYANAIDEIKTKINEMSLSEIDANRKQTVEAMQEQKRLIDEQSRAVENLNKQINDLNASREKPGITQENNLNITKAISILTEQLAVEEEKLDRMREKSTGVLKALKDEERRRNDLIKERVWRQNAEYQDLIKMNGKYNEANRLLGLGNQLLMARQGLASTPMRIHQADISQSDQQALLLKQQAAELAGLKGQARVNRQVDFDLERMGRTGVENYDYATAYRKAALDEYLNNEANKPKLKGSTGKTDAEKTSDVYDRLLKQQKEQIALSGNNTELAKVKYQIVQGELASLDQAKKQVLLQNAALIDQQKIREQLATYEANLMDSNASARAAQEAELIGYGQGSRLRERMQERLRIREEFQQKNADLQRQYQSGDISEELYRQELDLNKRYLDERLRDQQRFYDASDSQRADWDLGMREGFANWADTASDYASQSADLVNSSMTGLVGNISDALSGNKADWQDWANSILQSMQKIILNAMLVDSFRAASSSGIFGSLGGLFGGSSGGVTPSGAYNSAASGLTFNAKGGAYVSDSLSAYSNSVVNTPTYFAFAKGAGLMGEAGPEAIMPLTRSADGSLGVRVVGNQPTVAGRGDIIIQQTIHVTGNGDAALTRAMQQAAEKGANDGAKKARQEMLNDFQTRGQGRRLLGV